MPEPVTRHCDIKTALNITTATSPPTSTAIDYESYVCGEIAITAGSVTTLTWYTSVDGVNWSQKYDAGAALTSQVSSGRSCKIPDQLAGCKWICCSGDQAGTASASLKG